MSKPLSDRFLANGVDMNNMPYELIESNPPLLLSPKDSSSKSELKQKPKQKPVLRNTSRMKKVEKKKVEKKKVEKIYATSKGVAPELTAALRGGTTSDVTDNSSTGSGVYRNDWLWDLALKMLNETELNPHIVSDLDVQSFSPGKKGQKSKKKARSRRTRTRVRTHGGSICNNRQYLDRNIETRNSRMYRPPPRIKDYGLDYGYDIFTPSTTSINVSDNHRDSTHCGTGTYGILGTGTYGILETSTVSTIPMPHNPAPQNGHAEIPDLLEGPGLIDFPTVFQHISPDTNALKHADMFLSDPSPVFGLTPPLPSLRSSRKIRKRRKRHKRQRVFVRLQLELMELPEDVLVLMLTFVKPSTVCTSLRVSTTFNKLCQRSFRATTSVVIDSRKVAALYRDSHRITRLVVSPHPDCKDISKIISKNREHIKSLKLLSPAFASLAIDANLIGLKDLATCGWNVPTISEISRQHERTLTTLSLIFPLPISSSEFSLMSPQFTQLQKLSVEGFRGHTFDHITKHLPQLHFLRLDNGLIEKIDYLAAETRVTKLREVHFYNIQINIGKQGHCFFAQVVKNARATLERFTPDRVSPRLLFNKLKKMKVVLPHLSDLCIRLLEKLDSQATEPIAKLSPNLRCLTIRSGDGALQHQVLTRSCRFQMLEKLHLDGFFHWDVLKHVAESGSFPALKFFSFDMRYLSPVPVVDDEVAEIRGMFKLTKPNLCLHGGPLF